MMVQQANSMKEARPSTVPADEFAFHHASQLDGWVRIPQGTSLWGSGLSCGVQVLGPGVEDYHCLLLKGEQRMLVRSLNGQTWLNRQSFSEAEIHDGDVLRLGDIELRFSAAESGFLPRLALSPAVRVDRLKRQPPPAQAATVDREMLARMTQAEDDRRQSRKAERRMRRRQRDMLRLAHDLQQRWSAQARWIRAAELALPQAPLPVENPPLAGNDAGFESTSDSLFAALTGLPEQVKKIAESLSELDGRQQQLQIQCETWLSNWQQETTRLSETMQPISAELAELRKEQAEIASLESAATADQQAAFEMLAARCAALEAALAGLHEEQNQLNAERLAWQTESQEQHERLSRQTMELGDSLKAWASQPTSHVVSEPAAEPREEPRAAAHRHSMEDRLAGLRAEREAFEDLQRKERAEQALSRHLTKISPDANAAPVQVAPPSAESAPEQEPEQPIVEQPESSVHVEDSTVQELPASEQPLATPPEAVIEESPESAASPEVPTTEPADEIPNNPRPEQPQNLTEEPVAALPPADPFARISHLLKQKDAAPNDFAPPPHDTQAAVAAEPEMGEAGPEPTEEVAEETPAARSIHEAPVSAAELLRRMGHDINLEDDAETESTPARHTSPANEPAVVLGSSHARPESRQEQPPATSAGNAVAEGEDESIDDYMARLLNRVRTVSNDAKDKSQARQSESSYRPTAAPAKLAPTPIKPVLTEEEEELERRKQEYVRRAAPESTSDLRKFREVANMQARAAIDTHARKRLTNVRGNKLLVVATALLAMGSLFVLKWQGIIDSYLGIAGAAVVALFWGLQYLSIVLRSPKLPKPQPVSLPAADKPASEPVETPKD
ncbi:MAG: FHA domain-containing protein [Pirellulales bacterium]